jgi:hypothetical protein
MVDVCVRRGPAKLPPAVGGGAPPRRRGHAMASQRGLRRSVPRSGLIPRFVGPFPAVEHFVEQLGSVCRRASGDSVESNSMPFFSESRRFIYDKWLRARAYSLGSFWSSLIQEPANELDFFSFLFPSITSFEIVKLDDEVTDGSYGFL